VIDIAVVNATITINNKYFILLFINPYNKIRLYKLIFILNCKKCIYTLNNIVVSGNKIVPCKGLCERFRNTIQRGAYNKTDKNGNPMKNCRQCEYFCYYTNLYCSCCGQKYSTRPASKKKKYYKELEDLNGESIGQSAAAKQESHTSILPNTSL